MEHRVFAYFRSPEAAGASADALRDAGYPAQVSTVDDPEVPFTFGGGRSFVIGSLAGLVIGALFGVLVGTITIATPVTWPVMSAGLPAIITLFAFIFGPVGGFTGWFAARPWQVRHVVTSTTEPEHVDDVKRLLSRQNPSLVSEEERFGRRAA